MKIEVTASVLSFVGLVWFSFQDMCFGFAIQSPAFSLSSDSVRKQTSFFASNDQGDAEARKTEDTESESPKIVVVGGGWAGFSVADALSTDKNAQVTLLDASPRGQGGLAGGWRTALLKRPVEAGLHGFWREYKNTLATVERIGIDIDRALTPYTPSILVSQSGRVALAPVLGSSLDKETEKPLSDIDIPDLISDPSKVIQILADLLPPPLDVALLSQFSENSPLTVADRISGIGLLGAWADFGQEDEESWKIYDKVSAENLFCVAAGLSPTLYRELVTPLLHVLPMTPGYDCSAAAALSCFHVFALQSRGAFDVRWCRGTIAETIFNPWALQLQSRGNVAVKGSSKVTSIKRKDGKSQRKSKFEVSVNNETTIECDAVVMAVGATSMKRIVQSCPPFMPIAKKKHFDKLRGVTCVAVRLFLRPAETTTSELSGGLYGSTQLPPAVAKAMKDSPVIVCGPRVGTIPQMAETGFCIYDLQRLHDEFAVVNQENDGMEPCAALEVDFFRADTIANMKDDEKVAELALRAVAEALGVEPIHPSQILDVSVVRARDAVSHFCVNSASSSPGVKVGDGIYMCGDWIDRTGHASWSTEKAVVTGRQAAAAIAEDFGLTCSTDVIPAAPDTPQLSAIRGVAKTLRKVAPPPGSGVPPAPWVVANQIMSTFRRQ